MPWLLRILLAVIGGACIFLAFPNFNQFYLAYFALALILWAIEGLSAKKAFFLGWIAGFVTNIGGFYWIGSLLEDFGHMPPWVAMTLCVALCILQGLVFGIWAALTRKWNTKSIGIVAVPAFVCVEMFFPMIFPWYYANSQYNFVPAIQTADIFGVLGVSFLLAIVNVLLYDVTRTLWLRKSGVPWNRKSLLFGVAYLAFAMIYAPIRMAQIDAIDAESPKLEVGMVEGDVGIWESEPPEKLRNNLFIHHDLSRKLSLEGVDLIVWPESSYMQGLIWGSQLQTDDPVEHELDALYAEWFRPTARLIYHAVDSAFGHGFHRNPIIHYAVETAINEAALEHNFQNNENFYPALISGYPFECTEDNQIRKCPYRRIVPDDLTYYLPSAEPLRNSRSADIKANIRPEDFASPIRDFKAALIFGTLTITTREGIDVPFEELYRAPASMRKLFNTAHFIDRDGRVLGIYHKNFLLAFGEYIPFAEKFPWIYKFLPESGNLTPGDEVHTWSYKGFEIAPIICYEDILPRFVRDFSKLTPNVFVNVTNDAWFGKTSEPMLHLALAMMRTVEHRKWLIRSTNTGVSAFVDPNGRLVQHTSIYEPEILRQSVGMMPRTRTIYSVIGDVLGWVSLAWLIALAVLKPRKS